MRRSEYLALTRRLITHLENGTTDSAENVKYIPAEHYLDPVRWQREIDRIFKLLPLLLAFSCEMREGGDYKAMDVVGVPVLIARAKDGVVRAFVNVCSHRGTVIANDGKGNCTRFVCPYHGWTYSDRGGLIGIAGRRKFGEVDTDARGLTELPCAERAGLIFVKLTPGESLDLEEYLGGMLPELESLGFENWHLFKQNQLATSNWKVAHDGYLEGYHFSTLHPQTVGAQVMSNIMAYDAYGPHQRVAFPEHRIKEMMSRPSEEWKTEEGIAVVRTIFPNTSFAISSHTGGMVSQLIPGPTPDKSRTIQNHIFPRPPASDADCARMEATTRFFTGAVEQEDNWVCARIQHGLSSGGNKDFVFGKNELGLHRLHDWIDHFVNLPSDATDGADGARLRVVGSASKQSRKGLR